LSLATREELEAWRRDGDRLDTSFLLLRETMEQ
jgi:hypothetical protein